MPWLKSWLETRWKMASMVLMGVLLFGFLIEALGGVRIHHPQQFLFVLLRLGTFLCFITAITLAGSGIQTASPRPGSDKGSEGSTLFTLSLPVTRTRLYAVRTVTGVLEMMALLTLFGFVIWLLVPRPANQVALGYFAVIVASSLAVYAISACLSTFCDEGWRFRGSGLVVAALFMLSTAGRLPRSINIFGGIGDVTSRLVTPQTHWDAVATACVLALLFFGAALLIIQRRDY